MKTRALSNSPNGPSNILQYPFREASPRRRRASLLGSIADELDWVESERPRPTYEGPIREAKIIRIFKR